MRIQNLIWLVPISLLTMTGCGPISLLIATPTPIYTPTPTKTHTPAATHTLIPIPTVTAVSEATLAVSEATPAPTLTPQPTNTATPFSTSTPTEIAQPTATPTITPAPAIPESPATPTAKPAEASPDFRIASWRLWPLALNSGCAKGMHTIFITVLNADRTPLNDIIVGDNWDNVETVTGTKGPGKAEIDLWSNTMEMVVKGNIATGETYSSEVSFPFSSFMTTIPNEQMIAAGYCANELECDWKRANDSYYCGAHYSWEVIFQKTR